MCQQYEHEKRYEARRARRIIWEGYLDAKKEIDEGDNPYTTNEDAKRWEIGWRNYHEGHLPYNLWYSPYYLMKD